MHEFAQLSPHTDTLVGDTSAMMNGAVSLVPVFPTDVSNTGANTLYVNPSPFASEQSSYPMTFGNYSVTTGEINGKATKTMSPQFTHSASQAAIPQSPSSVCILFSTFELFHSQ